MSERLLPPGGSFLCRNREGMGFVTIRPGMTYDSLGGIDMLIVQKYGGTSLADAQRIRSAAHRATGLARQGNQVVVVVSAQGETTDLLIEKAAQINRRGAAREMDAYLAAGEQMSAGLMAMAIGAMGYPAVSMTGWQAGIATDGVHGNARIVSVDTHRIRQELHRRGVSREDADAALEDFSPDPDTLRALLDKKLKGDASDPKAVQRAVAFLQRRGFSWGDIRQALKDYGTVIDESFD